MRSGWYRQSCRWGVGGIRGVLMGLGLSLLLNGCLLPYEARHENQWDSREQIWLSEESQVKLRAAQSRVFDTTDRTAILEAVVATMQDIGFMVDVLDQDLGIVSAKKYVDLERPAFLDPSYLLYRPDTLLILSRNIHAWGPFFHRSDLVRLTATVRKRNDAQLVVRTSAQYYLRAVEDPAPYQQFFRTLEQALFLQGQSVE
ncbi:MAG: hypothetical protein HP498_10815 [Nitrospira sp.]|nr:hypothetical protein [Nitrospira sp.]